MERLLKSNGVKKTNITAAGGPCLAKGLANRIHTSVVFANKDIKIANQIAKLVSTDYYHIFTSDDVIGIETCAAIKNIFSMGVGASQGLCSLDLNKENLQRTIQLFNKTNQLNTVTRRFNEKDIE